MRRRKNAPFHRSKRGLFDNFEGAVAKPVCRKRILMVFFVRSERRLQRLRKGFGIKKQPLPKRIFFIAFEKSSGNNQKCLRTLGKLRSLCTKMLFQNFQVLQQPHHKKFRKLQKLPAWGDKSFLTL